MAGRATDHAVTSLLTVAARRRCDLNRYPERNVSRKRERETGVLFPTPVEPVSRLVGGRTPNWNVNRVGVTAGRDRHLTSLLNWRRAGLHLVRAPRRAFSGKAA